MSAVAPEDTASRRRRIALAVLLVTMLPASPRATGPRWMRERFGVAHDAYRARVKALVPFLF